MTCLMLVITFTYPLLLVSQVIIYFKTVSHMQIISKQNYCTSKLKSKLPLHIPLRQGKSLLLLNSKLQFQYVLRLEDQDEVSFAALPSIYHSEQPVSRDKLFSPLENTVFIPPKTVMQKSLPILGRTAKLAQNGICCPFQHLLKHGLGKDVPYLNTDLVNRNVLRKTPSYHQCLYIGQYIGSFLPKILQMGKDIKDPLCSQVCAFCNRFLS